MSRPAPHANMPRLGIKARADTQARRALTGPGFGTALVIPQGRHRLWGTGVGGGANPPPTPFQARLNSDRGTAARRQAPRRTRAADRYAARHHAERPQTDQGRARNRMICIRSRQCLTRRADISVAGLTVHAGAAA